jgi:hypothetical protein
MTKTLLEQAIDTLHRNGYRASPSRLFGGFIEILNPSDNSKTRIHHLETYQFLNERAHQKTA